MNIHARIARLTASFLVAAGLVVASPTQASAALSDCPSGYLCLWSGTNYTGTLKKISVTNSYVSTSLPTVRSYYNKRSYRSLLYSGTGGTGSNACVSSNVASPNVSGWPSSAKSVFLSSTVSFC